MEIKYFFVALPILVAVYYFFEIKKNVGARHNKNIGGQVSRLQKQNGTPDACMKSIDIFSNASKEELELRCRLRSAARREFLEVKSGVVKCESLGNAALKHDSEKALREYMVALNDPSILAAAKRLRGKAYR